MSERKVMLWHNAIAIDPYCTHEDYPLEDWQYEVANDYTRLSYRYWVAGMIESEGDD